MSLSDQVRDVLAKLDAAPRQSDVAREIGCSRELVHQIIAREHPEWRHAYRKEPSPKRPPLKVSDVLARRIRQVTTRQGRVGELLVASDLVARGFLVYWPLTGSGPDLIALYRNRSQSLIVEVRAGKVVDGHVRWARPEYDADLWAVVLEDSTIRYYDAGGIAQDEMV